MIQPNKWIIRTDQEFRGVTESFTYIDSEGIERVAYTNLTLEEYGLDRIYPFKLVSGEELDSLLEQFTQNQITEWEEISEERYWNMLEVLPPCKFDGSKFHISERLHGDLVSWFKKEDGKYFECVNLSTWEESNVR